MNAIKLDEFHGLQGREIFDLMTYDEYLKTNHWQKIRQKMYAESENSCQLCGRRALLNVHHNNYECLGVEKSTDLIVLCEPCHKHHHTKQEQVEHSSYTGFICPTCGAEHVVEIRVIKVENSP